MITYKPNFTELEKLSEEGYLRKVVSPCNKLVLFNYTDKCTFERKWNKHTLNSRGTVYEIESGKTVARAFQKFFNFSELTSCKQKTILNGSGVYASYTSHEKADGSLGIIYHYDGTWRVNTRGSFTSDQAIRGAEILKNYDISKLNKNLTYLCEIIYPENKIIVEYGDVEKLVLLAAFGTESGREVLLDGFNQPFEVAETYSHTIKEMIELQKTIPKDQEGFVVRFSNGERVKFKGHEYLQIARILKNCSPLALWENMSDGIVDRKFLETIPEEIYPEVEPIVEKLEVNYYLTLFHLSLEAGRVSLDIGTSELNSNEDRKKLGLYLKENRVKHSSAMFPYFLKQYDRVQDYIMKTIRPTGNVL